MKIYDEINEIVFNEIDDIVTLTKDQIISLLNEFDRLQSIVDKIDTSAIMYPPVHTPLPEPVYQREYDSEGTMHNV